MRRKSINTHDRAAGIIRSKARTFYLSSLFLPTAIRRDVHIVYAYYRLVDDLVDESPTDWSRDDVRAHLVSWEEALLGRGPVHDPIAGEVIRIAERHRIPVEYLLMVLEGAAYDLELSWVETREDLLHYSVLVAGSVGMVMTHILGSAEQPALDAARSLGVAMQITNVLRDVGEDMNRDRIYLPRRDLMRAGCTPDTLRRRERSPALLLIMRELVIEARDLYAEGMAGIRYLDPSVQFPIQLAASLYCRILDKIERQNYNVFDQRAHLGTMEKWVLTLPVYVQHRQALGGR